VLAEQGPQPLHLAAQALDLLGQRRRVSQPCAAFSVWTIIRWTPLPLVREDIPVTLNKANPPPATSTTA
jgi:hypothetical protein